jgi:hypothetical protein
VWSHVPALAQYLDALLLLLVHCLQVIPCVIMAAIAHPFTSHWIMFRVSTAVCAAGSSIVYDSSSSSAAAATTAPSAKAAAQYAPAGAFWAVCLSM